MKQRNIKHEKRLKKLVLTCLLLAVVLTVGTYAWFIGMQTVSVETLEVKIATVEDLALSLNGAPNSWSSALTVSESVLSSDEYAKTTYAWTGLKPVSTVGAMDADTNKMIMYDKGSLTATDGGYRLMSAQVEQTATAKDKDGNTISGENDGYVAFDLFIKNMSGDEYYSNISTPSNEEAIYLDDASQAIGVDAGSVKSGIENSVRIAFAQVGRVESNASQSLIQQISCASGVSGITPICTNRYAAIWEPNDKAHNTNAVKWYETTCKKRDVTSGAYTTTQCDAIPSDYVSYVVSGEIDETAKVDVYDGLNGYTGTVATAANKNKLVAIDTFTDTEKDQNGMDRKPIFTLAPNSVTKVRVYIYLEGQDVDNYDFASLGSAIKINFGFTKERFTTDDIEGLKDVIIPGAENFKKIAYTATGDVTEVSSTKVLYDADTKAFWYNENESIASFTFKDGATGKTATYSEDTGWTIS